MAGLGLQLIPGKGLGIRFGLGLIEFASAPQIGLHRAYIKLDTQVIETTCSKSSQALCLQYIASLYKAL